MLLTDVSFCVQDISIYVTAYFFSWILADLISSRTLPSITFTWTNDFTIDKYSAKVKCIDISPTYPAESFGQPHNQYCLHRKSPPPVFTLSLNKLQLERFFLSVNHTTTSQIRKLWPGVGPSNVFLLSVSS